MEGAPTLKRHVAAALFGSASCLALSVAPAAHADDAVSTAAPVAASQPRTASTEAARSGVPSDTTALPELIVEARRTAEPIQKVPETVTALSQTDLQVQNIQTSHDLFAVVPSLATVQSYGVNTQTFRVRGLGGVTAYFSEVPFGGGSPTAFLDMSQIEFLNGPQGTLFGRANIGGAILEQPQHPTMNHFGGYLLAQGGDYAHYQFQGAINIPLVEDHLAMRVAMNRTHTDGYTSQFGYTYQTASGLVSVPASSVKLDGIDEQEYRVSFELNLGRFNNYLLADFWSNNGTPHSEVGGGIFPGAAQLNSPFTLPAVYAGFCSQGQAAGFVQTGAAALAACEAQRASMVTAARNEMIAETARLAAGGSIRETPAAYNGLDMVAKDNEALLVDIAQYDFGELGGNRLHFKNVFGFSSGAGTVSGNVDGVGGMIEEFQGPDGQGGAAAISQEHGNALVTGTGNWTQAFYEEAQLQGDYKDDLLKWTAGGVISYVPVTKQTAGPGVAGQILQGVFTPNLGLTPAFAVYDEGGLTTREYGVYGFATLDLSRFGLHGLSFTGGYRYSWDTSNLNTRAGCFFYPNIAPPAGCKTPSPAPAPGAIYPSSVVTVGAVSKSQGYNYNFQLAEQVTDKWLVYATVARAYIPGFPNSVTGQTALNGGVEVPNYTPTVAPEVVMDYEVGTKLDFTLAGMPGRLDADYYRYDHSNIVNSTSFTAVLNSGPNAGQTLVVSYSENAGAATVQGVELQGALFPSNDWQITFNASYEDDQYKNFIGQDPLGVITYANAQSTYGRTCLPGSVPNSAKSAGLCLLDLSDSKFVYAPAWKGNVTVRYHLPIDEKYGPLWLTAQVFAQSREYFQAPSNELQQVLTLKGGNPNVNGWSQAPFATLNLRLDWTKVLGSRWNAAFYVNNVTDQAYALTAFPQIISLGFSPKTYAPPLMFGGEISTRF